MFIGEPIRCGHRRPRDHDNSGFRRALRQENRMLSKVKMECAHITTSNIGIIWKTATTRSLITNDFKKRVGICSRCRLVPFPCRCSSALCPPTETSQYVAY